MKPKHLLVTLITSLLLILSFALTSCTEFLIVSKIELKDNNVIEIAAGDFKYDDKILIVTYTNGKKEEVKLTEDMIPEAEKLNFYKMGEHDIKIVYNNRYSTTMKVKVSRHEFDDIYKLEGYTCEYDGQPHKVEVNYELPEGATIEYPYGNSFTNAGEYDITGVISKAGYNSKTLTTKLIIKPVSQDESTIVFEDQTFEYDGEIKTIEATGLPKGVTATYEIWDETKTYRLNNAINAGVYKIIAKFQSTDENYLKIDDREITLTINKAKYDMSSVSLSDVEKTYDNIDYVPALDKDSVLPTGVEVEFKIYDSEGNVVNSSANAGVYKIVAEFKGNNQNYEAIEPMEATLTVNKRVIEIDSSIYLDSKTVNFNREHHSLKIVGNIPAGVNVEYENNDQYYAGEYKVYAKFSAKDPNETVSIESIEGYIIINSIVESVKITDPDTGEVRDITEEDITFYTNPDNEEKTATIKGFDEETYQIYNFIYLDLETGTQTDIDNLEVGRYYKYEISFEFVDVPLNDSVFLSKTMGSFENYNYFGEVSLEGVEADYDGNAHAVTLVGADALPEGTTIKYSDGTNETNSEINAGEYTITCTITKNYYKPVELSATIKINKIDYDLSNLGLNDVERTFDGTAYEQTLNLPEGISAEIKYLIKSGNDYIDAPNTVNAGEYKISVTFSGEDSNHNKIEDKQAALVINPKPIAIGDIKFESKEIAWDGAFHTLTIEGSLPEGIYVEYASEEEGTLEFVEGTHQFRATFKAVDPNEKPDIDYMDATLTIVGSGA